MFSFLLRFPPYQWKEMENPSETSLTTVRHVKAIEQLSRANCNDVMSHSFVASRWDFRSHFCICGENYMLSCYTETVSSTRGWIFQ